MNWKIGCYSEKYLHTWTRLITTAQMSCCVDINEVVPSIDWWLFESCKFRTEQLKDGSKSWDLSTPEALYDYLTE